jgi:hypothetical protein
VWFQNVGPGHPISRASQAPASAVVGSPWGLVAAVLQQGGSVSCSQLLRNEIRDEHATSICTE